MPTDQLSVTISVEVIEDAVDDLLLDAEVVGDNFGG